MNGELAALVALALHGSVWLAGGGPAPPPDLRDAAGLRFVRTLTVGRGDQTWHGAGRWLAGLREDGADRLWLALPAASRGPLEPHLAAAFSNGGSWALLSTPGGATIWHPRWSLGDRHDPDRRVWDVGVTGIRVPPGTKADAEPVEDARLALLSALEKIQRFAEEQQMRPWPDLFAKARHTATTGIGSDSGTWAGLAPSAGVSPEALRLLAAAEQSWVFGGMGSWNDVGPADRAELPRYERLSKGLYAAILRAVVAGANADLVV